MKSYWEDIKASLFINLSSCLQWFFPLPAGHPRATIQRGGGSLLHWSAVVTWPWRPWRGFSLLEETLEIDLFGDPNISHIYIYTLNTYIYVYIYIEYYTVYNPLVLLCRNLHTEVNITCTQLGIKTTKYNNKLKR